MNKYLSFVALASIAAMLVACGGDDDDDHAAADITISESANESSEGFTSYLTRLIQSNADLLEPIDISGFNPPAPEQQEPASV